MIKKPDKEQLTKLYTVDNLSAIEVATKFQVSLATVNRWLKEYQVKKSKDQRLANVSKTKQAKTEEEKKLYSEHISKARKGKGLGITPWNKGKHGLQIAWNKGLHTAGRPRTAESLEKARQTCLEKYGVDWACQRQEARLRGQNSQSNIDFENKLKELNISYSREFPINAYSYDFKINNYLVEINPYATHNSTWGVRNNKPKEPNYHKNKSQLALNNGYFCIHIFDWDDKDKILNKFIPMQTVLAEDCKIKEISTIDAKQFLTLYHPQNYTNAKICLGLFLNNELVEVMTFGNPRFNKNYQWELLRLCAKPGYHIIGGKSRLLNYFKAKYSPKNIIVYCDLSKLSGKIYEDIGFTLLKKAQPSLHWYNPKTNTHITNTFLWTKGFDRLFGTDYGKQVNNNKLMLEHGFVEIYDCGQATYVWKN